jgi:hypothetical protein
MAYVGKGRADACFVAEQTASVGTPSPSLFSPSGNAIVVTLIVSPIRGVG